LKFLEGPSYGRSYADGVIDSKDAAYSHLVLWCDANHNGVSEPNEIRSISDAGYLAFRTDYRAAGRRDPFGNLFRLRAKATGPEGEHYIYDVFLKSKQ
jgi:hypothetical protein